MGLALVVKLAAFAVVGGVLGTLPLRLRVTGVLLGAVGGLLLWLAHLPVALATTSGTDALVWVLLLHLAWGATQGQRWLAIPRWVPAISVHGLGRYALILDSDQAVTEQPQAPDDVRLLAARHDVLGKPVVTVDGEHLGDVRDYELSRPPLALLALGASPRFSLPGLPSQTDTIPMERVVILGEDAVIVAREEAPLLPAKEEEEERDD